MAKSKTPPAISPKERRSGLNRRWIKTAYRGEERRSGDDRRTDPLPKNLPVAENNDPLKVGGFEKLLVSNTVQLEAITRLLLEKRIIKNEELIEMMKRVQSEYWDNHET